jgi:hypothetical protein
MRLLWSEGETFRPELSVTAELRPGPGPAVYLVKTPSLMGYEGLVLNRLRLEPTDEEGAEVAIDWIRILPREGLYSGLGHGLGREEIGNESRNVIYARTPASFSLLVLVPPAGRLDVGVGLLDAVPGARFRVTAAPTKMGIVVLDQEVRQDERWVDLRVDLSRFAGRWTDLTFSVESKREGCVALWSNPAVYSATDHLRAPSVLVYLIDTLRADHVGAYGDANLTTPQIDRVAREGAVYLSCTAQAPLTRPSVASIMTSLYPPEHGVIDHGQGVSEGVITLAEQFRRYGYATAGFSASPHAGSSANLVQGFDQFLEPPAVLGASATILDNHAPDYSRASAEAINARLLPWLARCRPAVLPLCSHARSARSVRAAAYHDALFDRAIRPHRRSSTTRTTVSRRPARRRISRA